MNHMGKDGFVWFQGVVEDRKDPMLLGRCKIRCLGYHTDDKTLIPTENLPWAFPIQPITSAAMNGIGNSPLGPVEGTWVIGFFRDGFNLQEPVFFGTIGGIVPVEKPNTNRGFCDPSGIYPKDGFTAEQDTNRLARGITSGTIVESKISGATTDYPTANNAGDSGWGEPETPFMAEYPYNYVYQSESGHIQEFDDTPESERIHTYHKSGTFEEIHPGGGKVVKVVGDDYEFTLGKKFINVVGNTNILIGPKSDDEEDSEDEENIGNFTLYIKGSANIQVDGSVNQVVNGDVKQNINGDVNITSDGDFELESKNITMKATENINIETEGSMVLKGTTGIDLNPPEGQ